MALRVVLFDVGNTLLHLDYAFVAATLDALGHPRPVAAIRLAEYAAKAALDAALLAERQGTAPGAVEDMLWPGPADRPSYFAVMLEALGLQGEAAGTVLDTLATHHRARSLWRVVDPGAVPTLAHLRARGLTLGVISNADGRIERDLGHHGLRAHFATIVDSGVAGVEKPSPAIFRLALARLAARPDEALYVGDIWAIDVLGARGAGLDAILIDALGRYPGAPDCPRIRSVAELPARIGLPLRTDT